MFSVILVLWARLLSGIPVQTDTVILEAVGSQLSNTPVSLTLTAGNCPLLGQTQNSGGTESQSS